MSSPNEKALEKLTELEQKIKHAMCEQENELLDGDNVLIYLDDIKSLLTEESEKPKPDSNELINRATKSFEGLKHKEYDWRSYYNGFLNSFGEWSKFFRYTQKDLNNAYKVGRLDENADRPMLDEFSESLKEEAKEVKKFPFIKGKYYWQQHCKKWLRYTGNRNQTGNGYWHTFTLGDKVYNELKVWDLDGMFDLNKDKPANMSAKIGAYESNKGGES